MSKGTINNYRPDIDGLRAVAVLLVIFYHVGLPIQGGYVGVDVFFVISGYLITGIISRDISDKKFSYKTFYFRRMKRLLPAFLVMAIGTTLLIRTYYLPDDFKGFSESLRYALLGISNFYFLKETTGYFGNETELLPLIHTWSLSVEEQFYVIWPLLISAFLRFSQAKGRIVILSCVFLGLLVVSEWMARQSPHAAYYMLPSRAFELMMGGWLALDKQTFKITSYRVANTLSLTGLVLILGSAFILNKSNFFPGINAFFPCLGTVLLILTGNSKTLGCVNRWLSKPVPVAIGLISYSAYLWHWPPIALANYLNIELSYTVSISLIIISLIMGWLSWRFIEKPFRFKVKWSFRTAFILLFVVPLIAFIGFNKFLRETHGNPMRLSKELYELAKRIGDDQAQNIFSKCHKLDAEIETASNCLFGDLKSNMQNPDFLLLGDSHANAAHGFFEALASDAGLSGLEVSSSGSPFLINTDKYEIENNKKVLDHKYRARIEAIQDYIDSGFKGFFVLAARWPYYILKDKIVVSPEIDTALVITLDYLEQFNVPIFIYLTVPELPENASVRCQGIALLEMPLANTGDNCSPNVLDYEMSQFFDRQKPVSIMMDKMASQFPDLKFIDPKQVICKGGNCTIQFYGRTIYRDDDHLNYSGSQIVGEEYLKEFGNPLENSKVKWEISDIWR